MVFAGVAVTAIVGVLAAAGSAYAAYRASEAQSQQQQYASKVAKNQAAQAAYNAQINAENQRLHNRRVMGAQRAALGASGVMPSEGSPLLVQMDSVEQGMVEEQRLLYGGQVRSDALISESRYLKKQASQTRELGYVNAGTTLLGGTARAGAAYYGSTSTSGKSTGYNEYRGESQP